MSAQTSNWIPRKRIRLALGLALGLAAAGLIGSVWSPVMLGLMVPALAAGWAGALMLWIRRQLSSGGGGWQSRIHQAVVSRLAPNSRASVLDIGCGDASLLIALLEKAPAVTVTGVDFWGANWAYAQSACEARVENLGLQASFRRIDAARLDIPDDTFDLVVSVMCFHEVRSPLTAVSEALRVLRPGGAFLFIDRFDDPKDFGDRAELNAVLRSTVDLRHAPSVESLGIPWPLNTPRALGPVAMLSGRKAARH